jgi:hypothetical protein
MKLGDLPKHGWLVDATAETITFRNPETGESITLNVAYLERHVQAGGWFADDYQSALYAHQVAMLAKAPAGLFGTFKPR